MSLEDYKNYLERLPISFHTRRNYLARVKRFLEWLANTIDGNKALSSTVDRDFALRDYRLYLLQSGAKPATVNAAFSALDNYFIFNGLGPARLRRQELPEVAPRALESEELKRVLREIARLESARNKTIMLMLLHTGLRISELAALNVGDVFVTARRGELAVRCGKNAKHRRIPLNSDLREVLQIYLSRPQDPAEPLFKSQLGSRISTSSIDHLCKQVARDAGVEMSAHTMRHTCLSRLIRAGIDVITVSEIAGHSRVETTRRYSLPSAKYKAEAMERLNYDSA